MKKITLIGTVHGERGLCNKEELVRILELIAPEVVFEEISKTAYRQMYVEDMTWKLESGAIKEYQNHHSITHVPVDQVGVSGALLRRHRDLHMQVERRSRTYQVLCDQDIRNRSEKGFRYLNSDESIKFNRQFNKEIEDTVARIVSDSPRAVLNEWIKVENSREQDMVDSIYSFSRDNDFKCGVFFCGAAHREGIIEKIQVYESNEPDTINWNYSDYEGLF